MAPKLATTCPTLRLVSPIGLGVRVTARVIASHGRVLDTDRRWWSAGKEQEQFVSPRAVRLKQINEHVCGCGLHSPVSFLHPSLGGCITKRPPLVPAGQVREKRVRGSANLPVVLIRVWRDTAIELL